MARRPTALAGFVALVLVAPLTAGSVLAVRAATQSPLESASEPEPLVAAVESATRTRQVGVAIAVVPGDALTPRTDASGLVTALGVGPGDTVSTGTVVAILGEAHVVAYQAERPLYADASPGAKGPAAAAAQQVLTDLGYYAGPLDGEVGTGTVAAIRAFNTEHGYGKTNTTFSLAALTWIGPGPVTVAQLSIRAGDTLGPGTDLFTTTAALAGIGVTETASIVRDAPVKLVVSGFEIAYAVGSGMVTDPQFTTDVAASLGTATEGAGTIELAEPVTVGTLPASAVITDAEGRTCFFESLTASPTPVAPAGEGSVGVVDVDPSLVGTPALVNPREVRDDLTCG